VRLFPSRGAPPEISRRASPENPSTNLANPAAWLFDAFGAKQSAAGVAVNERTALQSTAVYACVRILAETIASLPLPVFRRRGARGKDIARDHPLYSILHDRPNPEMSSFTFRETLQGHLSLWGNAYAEIETAKSGRVLALWPLRPDVTTPVRLPNGERIFKTKINGETQELPADRVLHVPGMGFDGLVGYSPIALSRQAIGLALATEEFGAKFFGNGTRPGGVLTHPARLSKEAKERLKEGWQAAYGGLTNAQRVAVLEEGVTWQALGVPPDEAQFLETRKFQTTEIARIFRVPPHMLADLERATFSNIEHQSIEFVVHTIRPWLVRWEQVMNWSLFSERDQGNAFAEFQVEGLLRGDSAQRASFYSALFNMGVLSPNDIRERENMNPVEGGDVRLVPLNMTTLENAGEPQAPQPAAEPTQPDAGEGQQDADRAHTVAVERLLTDVMERIVRREAVHAKRAEKRGDLASWVDAAYGEPSEVVALAVTEAIETAAMFAGCDAAAARSIATGHGWATAAAWANDSKGIIGATNLETWEAEAAPRFARHAAPTIAAAISNLPRKAA
jgi:HK97 family phage portal protein